MRNEFYSAIRIREFLDEHSVATLQQIKEVLGTDIDMTVFRKLKALEYLSSYTHRGKFYTLRRIAKFNEKGLWAFDAIRFSCFGTLVSTAKIFVNNSDAGYTTNELKKELNVEVKGPLYELVKDNQIYREKVDGIFLHVAIDRKIRDRQIMARRDLLSRSLDAIAVEDNSVLAHELRAAIILFVSLLDEKQRRLWAGLESMRMGYGGDQTIATLLNIDAHTVARGRNELLNRDVEINRVRKWGGGRLPIKKKVLK